MIIIQTWYYVQISVVDVYKNILVSKQYLGSVLKNCVFWDVTPFG
jgi:hypothetical protein